MNPVRPIFSQRGKPVAPPRSNQTRRDPAPAGKRRHLRAVNPDRARRKNPDAEAIPWKTIIITTLVTSFFSTFAMTFARYLIERTKSRKELRMLAAGMGMQPQQQAVPQQTVASHGQPQPQPHSHPTSVPNPAYMFPQYMPPGMEPPSAMLAPAVRPIFPSTNPSPYVSPHAGPGAGASRGSLMPHLPSPPHREDEGEPQWMMRFRQDMDRRLSDLEQRSSGG